MRKAPLRFSGAFQFLSVCCMSQPCSAASNFFNNIAALGVEVVAGGGAEDGEAANVVLATEFGDLFSLGDDEVLHRVRPSFPLGLV